MRRKWQSEERQEMRSEGRKEINSRDRRQTDGNDRHDRLRRKEQTQENTKGRKEGTNKDSRAARDKIRREQVVLRAEWIRRIPSNVPLPLRTIGNGRTSRQTRTLKRRTHRE